jgi:Tol biopolymer transport system component
MICLLQAAGFASCEPSASSPVEPVGTVGRPEPSNSAMTCSAQDHPILFQAMRSAAGFEPKLFLMNVEGTDQTRITPTGYFHSPAWSPDGHSIAFRRRGAPSNVVGVEASSMLGLMAPDGTEQSVLVEDESAIDDAILLRTFDGPTWSPDGRSLAFASRRGSGEWAVWTLSRSGGQLQRLIPDLKDAHFDPNWARHDRSKLAFVADSGGVRDIWVVDVSAPARRENVTEDLTDEELISPDSPAWSPDGSRLAFSARDPRGGDEEVYVLELSTRNLVQVTDDDSMDLSPAWSPDGRALLIGSNRVAAASQPSGSLASQLLDLWRVSVDGSEEPVRLTRMGTMSTEADWYGFSSCGDTH